MRYRRNSETDVLGGRFYRPRHFQAPRDEQLGVKPGEITVDEPVVIGDKAFTLLGESHVVEALGVQALLLARQIGEVLGGNRRPARIIGGPGLGGRELRWSLALRVQGGRPDLKQAF